MNVSGDKNIKEWYAREDVQLAIFEAAKNKEIGVKYEWGFGKRPDVIATPGDVYELAKNGATSFHFSEELWENPLIINQIDSKKLNTLRKGWDLVIDIDTPYFEYSKIATIKVIEFLKSRGIHNISCKFSGNHGFHIALPFESFPEKILMKETRTLFPEAPRKIAEYIKRGIEKKVVKEIFEMHSTKKISENIGTEITMNSKMDEMVEIDTILISSRHLCRMPYVFNEKSGLISIPVKFEDIKTFDRINAKVENITKIHPYIEREKSISGEAEILFVEAFDSTMDEIKKKNFEERIPKKEIVMIEEAIPEEYFPDCIKKLLMPLSDGKKRALFVLINFLASMGWNPDMIEERIKQWNLTHPEPLREIYWKGQVNYAKKQPRRLPPNCNNSSYYEALGVKCKNCTSKNPTNFARKRFLVMQSMNKKENPKSNEKKKIKNNKKLSTI